MGSKRVGLARMESLVKQLKRELALGASAGIKMGADDYLVPCYPDAAFEDASGSNPALSVACYHSRWTTSGSNDDATLAAGTVLGQMKKITLVSDGGNGTVTIADPVSASLDVISFQDVGDTAELMWNGSAWRIISLHNTASGDTGPTVA